MGSLDKFQLAAVEHGDGPAIVLAGPGSGKTRVIVERAVRLIDEERGRPEQLLVLTFSRKAATDLRERLTSRLQRSYASFPVTTFHAFCLSILAQGAAESARLARPAERRKLMREALEQNGNLELQPSNALLDEALRFAELCDDYLDLPDWDFGSSWSALDAQFSKGYPNNLIGKLDGFLSKELRSHGPFFPDPCNIFRAFKLTPLDEVKVVIVGQDPYADGRAMGLAFSVNRGEELPRSLRNIYRVLQKDVGIPPAAHGDLTSWAEQGVLPLNSVLTVRSGEANSHRRRGWWTAFTSRALTHIGQACPNAIFLLWGAQAEAKRKHLEQVGCAHIYTASHPSPRTCSKKLRKYPAFLNCGHFKKANKHLLRTNQTQICWEIPP